MNVSVSRDWLVELDTYVFMFFHDGRDNMISVVLVSYL